LSISRPLALAFFLSTLVVLPVVLIVWLWLGRVDPLMTLARHFFAGGLVLFVYLTGYWGFLLYRLRVAAALGFLAVLAWQVLFLLGAEPPVVVTPASVVLIALGIVPMIAACRAIVARRTRDNPIRLRFPFDKGVYYALEGGDSSVSRFMNYHFAGSSHKRRGVNRSMRYAVDLVKLDSRGCFADGLLPVRTSAYWIFGQRVLSPCDGKVVHVQDGLPDERPFGGKHPYNVGNHIVIETCGINVILGHLESGTITVRSGDAVGSGRELARVGNSGLTEFPHLHIQASKTMGDTVWSGQGVPMLFDGRFLCKNDLFRAVKTR
jgi:hypothetical protein